MSLIRPTCSQVFLVETPFPGLIRQVVSLVSPLVSHANALESGSCFSYQPVSRPKGLGQSY